MGWVLNSETTPLGLCPAWGGDPKFSLPFLNSEITLSLMESQEEKKLMTLVGKLNVAGTASTKGEVRFP